MESISKKEFNSKIFVGEIMHSRLKPLVHTFKYPVYFYSFDLDELSQLSKKMKFLFGYNALGLVSVHDRDYFSRNLNSIRSKLLNYLSGEGIGADEIGRIEMITSARYFRYVFNPVSFYYCYQPDGKIRAIVSEVNNTFGERHLYLLTKLESGPNSRTAKNWYARQRLPKDFHVSPFNDVVGDYDFYFSENSEKLEIRLDILEDGKPSFLSYMKGESKPLGSQNLLRTLLRFPVTATLTMPRILWQAALLHYGRKLKVFTKPIPQSQNTILVKPLSWSQKVCMKIIHAHFKKLRKGALTLVHPEGELFEFGDRTSQLRASLRIRDFNFYRRCIRSGDIGFGESFSAGEWETHDLKEVLRIFIENWNCFDDRSLKSAVVGRFWNRIKHLARRNHLHGAKKNIQFHYDLSNEFFQILLDPSMMYSCAIFKNAEMSLEEAQYEKIRSIIAKARIKANEHILEIGSGWGTFAIEAVKQTGCRVTTLTISERQFEFAKKRIEEAGLQEKIDIRLLDYRKLEGKFDKIISIEMLEAVGEKEYPRFFSQLESLLKPNGLAVLQVISIPDQRFEKVRKGVDWIQKHIFPGSLCPSLSCLNLAMRDHSQFYIEDVENIGSHYAKTLRLWKENFLNHIESVKRLGFSGEFLRAWDYYLTYCEAGFSSRVINNYQLVLSRPHNRELSE